MCAVPEEEKAVGCLGTGVSDGHCVGTENQTQVLCKSHTPQRVNKVSHFFFVKVLKDDSALLSKIEILLRLDSAKVYFI